ncbi:TPA: hypothetical protein NJ163_003210 [Vibrio parahaemolyticus]|nr:hypothetical protein [Vibrio parahaemolyticus]
MMNKSALSAIGVLGILIWGYFPQAERTATTPESQSNTPSIVATRTTSKGGEPDGSQRRQNNNDSATQHGRQTHDALTVPSNPEAQATNSGDVSQHPPAQAKESTPQRHAQHVQTYAAMPPLEAQGNHKPVINPLAYQRLQNALSEWELVENKPTRFRLWVADLFDDPEHDFLSTRIELHLNGVKMSGSTTLIFQGTPEATETPQLIISAHDHQHGNEEEAWVSATFELSMLTSEQVNTHPLEGETVYRLETTHFLNGQYTLYEVVYCEAFKFVQQEVFYAAANNKRSCPTDEQLSKVGTFTTDANTLTVSSHLSSLDAQQVWTLQKQYPSVKHPEVSNYFVSVYNGKQFESYTMQKNRSAMEERINALTGQYLYQMPFFDYLLPLPNGEYLLSEIGNFIFDHDTQIVGPYGESIDSDLNLRTDEHDLHCADIAPWYGRHVIAGQGKYQIDIISNPYPDDPTYKIDCYQYTSNLETGQQSLAFDLNYSPYDELIEGEVYSYILRPKPEYAQRVEEIKLNLIYHAPPE